ncbi:MAG: hypothetical protein IBJ11_12350 [Phycisphaerales bacterium]|nr:hypothetical protein [Phycisphaerales bacterium]
MVPHVSNRVAALARRIADRAATSAEESPAWREMLLYDLRAHIPCRTATFLQEGPESLDGLLCWDRSLIVGDIDDDLTARLARYVRTCRADDRGVHLLRSVETPAGAARRRDLVPDDHAWHADEWYLSWRLPAGLDDFLYARALLPTGRSIYLAFCRAPGAEPFTEDERDLAYAVHTALIDVYTRHTAQPQPTTLAHDGHHHNAPNTPHSSQSPNDPERALDAFPQRLEHVVDVLGRDAVRRATGISRESLRRYLGGQKPTTEFIASLCANTTISANWLLLGHGPVHTTTQRTQTLDQTPLAELIGALQSRLATPTTPLTPPTPTAHPAPDSPAREPR